MKNWRRGTERVVDRPGRLFHPALSAAVMASALLLAGVAAPSAAQPAAAMADLHSIIRAGDAEALNKAVAAGADINGRDAWGRTALIVALQQGKAATVESLIKLGADISLTDAWGRTPLLVATQFKNTPAVRLLLARAADVNRANHNDITPLIATAQTANLESMALLLAAGAALGRTDNLGWTALMWAASRNDAVAVKMLVDKGADVGTVGRDGTTALSLARARDADAAVLGLLAGSAPAVRADGPVAAPPRPSVPGKAVAAGALREPRLDPQRIVRGQLQAPVTIVEYTDFQCPYCAAGAKAVEEVLARYEGQARLVVKHMPLQFHPMAKPAAEFFEALALQSPARAWAFYDRLFANPGMLAGGEPSLRKLASDLGADLGRLDLDRAGAEVRTRLASDLQEVQRFQFDGVPAFIVNGRVIVGAQPAQVFIDVIDAVLRQ